VEGYKFCCYFKSRNRRYPGARSVVWTGPGKLGRELGMGIDGDIILTEKGNYKGQ
jgi:hypothetical protein